jgi:hypothetical protein
VFEPNLNPPPPPSPPARYGYLVGRLRGRQITMEEATELFAVQQAMIAQANAMAAAPAIPPPPDSSSQPMIVPAPPATGAAMFSDENVALGLLAMGVGSGLLAAVLKRAQEGPKPKPTP